MRVGLRLQVVFVLAGVLVVFVVPLYLATVAYTETAHRASLHQQAHDLLNTVAQSIEASKFERPEQQKAQLRALLSERISLLRHESATETIELSFQEGDSSSDLRNGEWVQRQLRDGARLHVFITTPQSVFHKLNPLLVLYMLVSSLALLAGVYYIVTHLIIRPLDRVSLAARNVLSAEHALSLPGASSPEFADLHHSLRSMTERLRQDEGLQRQKVAELQAAKKDLEQAQAQIVRSERLASVGQLAAGLAHEVGNPIAAIMGLQDLILQGDLTPSEQAEFVARMRKETERINRILKDLLRFARSQPLTTNEPLLTDVKGVIDETLALLQPQPSFRNIEVRCDLEANLPLVRAHHEPVMQILLNLLLNAAAACNGGGTVRITATALAPARVELAVEDSGPGVAPELYETLFEPFVSGKESGEGTGLGLSVCRSLVEQIGLAAGLDAHAASIDLDRDFSTGARFIVQLPAHPVIA